MSEKTERVGIEPTIPKGTNLPNWRNNHSAIFPKKIRNTTISAYMIFLSFLKTFFFMNFDTFKEKIFRIQRKQSLTKMRRIYKAMCKLLKPLFIILFIFIWTSFYFLFLFNFCSKMASSLESF